MRVHDLTQGRMRREWRTVEAMIRLGCKRRHGGGPGGFCEECTDLRDYARFRLERCPFGSAKPTCANCKVHCYRPEPRQKMRELMRWAGPEMMARHPYLTLMHLLVDERRPAPDRPLRASARQPLPGTS